MKYSLSLLLLVGSLAVLSGCQTMELSDSQSGSGAVGGTRRIQVQGTEFFPDETGATYIIGDGCKVVGAAGTNCQYIVEAGGSLTAHTGNGNTYHIKAGGHFRGFSHAATNCTIKADTGAVVEREQSGPGTTFQGAGGQAPAAAPTLDIPEPPASEHIQDELSIPVPSNWTELGGGT